MYLVKWLSRGWRTGIWSGVSTPLFLDLPPGPSSCISHCYTDRKKIQGGRQNTYNWITNSSV